MDPCSERVAVALFGVLENVGTQVTLDLSSKKVQVERNRREPLTEEELPSLVLFEGDPIRVDDLTGQDGYEMPFMVQGAVLGRAGDAARLSNRLKADLYAALMEDLTLGGIVSDVRVTAPGDWIGAEVVSADTEGFMLAFAVHYATAEGDPYTFV